MYRFELTRRSVVVNCTSVLLKLMNLKILIQTRNANIAIMSTYIMFQKQSVSRLW